MPSANPRTHAAILVDKWHSRCLFLSINSHSNISLAFLSDYVFDVLFFTLPWTYNKDDDDDDDSFSQKGCELLASAEYDEHNRDIA